MAKQDLVVKLLLDSGAFGNDLRMAEKKAQDFKNNLQGAGKTAGEFSKAIGLSTGALGKLGGVLGGAGLVIGGIEAFKSVMLSANGTAKEFKGTIAGFEGVLDTFQTSLATFDFSNFTGGMQGIIDMFNNFKDAKKANIEFERGGLAYGVLAKKYDTQLKALENKLKKATTQEEGDSIKAQAQLLINEWRTRTVDYTDIISEAFIKELISADNKISKEYATPENIQKAILAWAERENDTERQEADKQLYEDISKRFQNLNRGLGNAKSNKEQSINFDDYNKYLKLEEYYQKEIDKILSENQELFILNQLYTKTVEKLKAIVDKVNTREEVLGVIEDREKQISEWSLSSSVSGSGSGSGSGSKKDKDEPIVGSINELRKTIKALEDLRDNKIDKDSEEFKIISEDINVCNKELDTYLKLMKSVEEVNKEESKKSYKDFGLEEVTQLNQSGSLNNIKTQIELTEFLLTERENLRDSLEHGSDAWKKEQDAVTAYKAELENLNEQYAELSGSNQIDAITKWNVGLSATVQLLDGVSSAMQNIEDDSAKMVGNVISVFSDMADGIMSFIQIQQAAASASGVASASAMPFPYNLAAMASVMGTVLSIFSKIKAMTAGKFAEGGIVGGTSFTGDKLFAQVNSGEMILNKRQQKNLSNMLGNGGQVEFVISGDSLVGVLNNKHNKRNLTR